MSEKNLYSRLVVSKPGDLLGVIAALAYLFPKNFVSYLTGVFARIKWPMPIGRVLKKAFVSVFRLDMNEAELPLGSYETVEDVFTRKLKLGARPIIAPFCSPSDGYLARSEPVSDHHAVQAKGINYRLSDLILGEAADAGSMDLAWFVTVYLAPHNYHRVHSPVTGQLRAIRYLPGTLWPVNRTFVQRIPRLFNSNERLVFDIALEGGGQLYLTMVGALNVGRMTTPFLPNEATNGLDRQFSARPKLHKFATPFPIACGTELGTFLLGSTVVLALDKAAAARFPLVQTSENRPILMGQSLLE